MAQARVSLKTSQIASETTPKSNFMRETNIFFAHTYGVQGCSQDFRKEGTRSK